MAKKTLKGRYDNIPISDKTKEGMRLSIDDLAAIGRLLTLQDNAYEQMFDEFRVEFSQFKLDILDKLCDHEKRIRRIETELNIAV
jgi:hypothetical protein